MGLLDDAIREHLELKRRHGADPGDLAKLEREAFGPIKRGAEPAEEPEAAAPAAPEPEPVDPVLSEPEVDAPPPAPAAVEEEEHVTWDPPAREPEPEPEPEPAPGRGQETQAFDAADVAEAEGRLEPAPRAAEPGDDDEDAEDVLEETPEFLQETPEHDRLWFEQRPPRDFDFDG
jgi:hypothetical protein